MFGNLIKRKREVQPIERIGSFNSITVTNMGTTMIDITEILATIDKHSSIVSWLGE